MVFRVLTRVGPRNHILDGIKIPHRKGHLRGVSPIRRHCNNELRNNDWMLIVTQYTDRKPLASTIYRWSLIDRHLHLQEISKLKVLKQCNMQFMHQTIARHHYVKTQQATACRNIHIHAVEQAWPCTNNYAINIHYNQSELCSIKINI